MRALFMTEFTFSVIHLGNVADLDPVDGNATAENQDNLLGTYRGDGDAASSHITTITAQDTNADNKINTNDNATPEAVSFDLGSGTVNTFYDSLYNVNVTVNFAPGSGEPPYNGLGGIIQTETGDLFFVMIDDDAGLGTNSLDNVPIHSITVNSISTFGNQQTATASDDQSFVPCFAAGTRVGTKAGIISVQDLRVGDWVKTLDHGFQKVLWVGRRFLSPQMLTDSPNLKPIYIEAGALGENLPNRDLILSPQHRVMLRSRITRRLTDQDGILVAAKKLVGFHGIRQLDCGLGVQYHHFACAAHQLVWANGTPAETFLRGSQAKFLLSNPASDALAAALPQAQLFAETEANTAARPIVQSRALLNRLLRRHIKNGVDLVTL